MEITCKNNMISPRKGSEDSWDLDKKFDGLVKIIPRERDGYGGFHYFYENFWCPSRVFKAFLYFQNHFKSLGDDIILASAPKCGTTWLKSLIFMVVNRDRFELENNPLLSSTPHKLVPYFEYDVYSVNPDPYLEKHPDNSPRIFSTHIPYASLPSSIVEDSQCKIVYVCRNPMDMFISYWHFTDKLRPENVEPITLEDAFEKFSRGVHSFGPFCDHVLGYWEAKQRNPNKILFLKYEDLKEDIVSHTKELAEFLGFPFSKDEEDRGLIEEITKLCSFEKLRELEVNKSGKNSFGNPNNAYFRKGAVGDWSNYLLPSMVENFKKHVHDKLDEFGLTFKLSCQMQTVSQE